MSIPNDDSERSDLEEWIRRAESSGFLSHPMIDDVLARQSPQADYRAGDQIGGYRILELLGTGGRACVYLAEQLRVDGRKVAVKVYQRTSTDELQGDIAAEIRTLARLEHPHLARIIDAGSTADGRVFVVMPLLNGVPLDVYHEVHQLGIHDTVRLVCTAARAVQFMHDQGIVHCDLKPSNIIVDANGHLTITDMDTAKFTGEYEQLSIRGTLGYLAPEQILNSECPVEPRTDIYALGATLFCLFSGKAPFQEHSIADAIVATNWDPPTLPTEISDCLPPELVRICMKCLEKQPTDRFASAGELANALQDVIDSDGRQNTNNPPANALRIGSVVLAGVTL